MSLIDIKAIETEAKEQIAKERSTKARDALVRQLRVVEGAKTILRAEELKLDDIKAQIADGTL